MANSPTDPRLEALAEIIVTTADELSPDTPLANFLEWDSTARVMFVAMVDQQFGRQVKGADIVAAKTVGDLLRLLD